MDPIAAKIKLNILAVNFPQFKHAQVRALSEMAGHFIDFTNIKDAYNQLITIFPDYIILYIEPPLEFGDPSLDKLKHITTELHIPFTVIETSPDSSGFYFRINDPAAELISSPFGKNFFFKYIDGMIKTLSSRSRIRMNSDPALMINTLLTGLISQKRLDVDLLPEFESLNRQNVNDEKRRLEASLWTAFENNRFRLYYQPVMSLEHNRISGFEALIRLMGEDGNIISPDKFIAVAEESALIAPLGLWIVEEACRQMKSWKEKYDFSSPLRINVNISPRQFIFPELTKSVFELTERYGICSDDMGFEITESALMGDMESANIALLEFRSRNFMLYMDDFGTGYSSLSYLMHFPVNIIKIDQSFVKWMHIDDQSEILVKSLIALAHNLGLKVVAEGTDDESHIELLKNFGCDYAQGYYFAKPLAPGDAETFLDKYFERK